MEAELKKKFIWKDPQIHENMLEVEDISIEATNGELYDVIVKNMEKSEYDFYRCEFTKVHFLNCKFENVVFERCYFEEVIFENCSFHKCNFSNSNFHIVKQIDTFHRNTDFSESSFYCANYSKCNMKYSNFNGCRINGFRTVDCDFDSSFFATCIIDYVLLEKTSFSSADFFQTPLKGLDFSDCDIEGIVVSDNKTEIEGIIVNSFQAIQLSRLFGIVIK